MKKWIIGLAVLFTLNAFVFSAFAGPSGRLSSEEFNSIISENMQLQKELAKQLQKSAGIEKSKVEKSPGLKASIEDLSVEQVAVGSSQSLDTSEGAKVPKNKSTEIKRLSEEVKEALTH